MAEFIYSEGLGATLNVAKPTRGSSVAIFGLGAVGLAVSVHSTLCFSIQCPFVVIMRMLCRSSCIRLLKELG